jgi:hypothetical protein
MVKDSALVRKVEKFLEENNINILEMSYNRTIEFDGKPTFDVLTSNLKSLRKLSQKIKKPLREDYDERSHYKELSISKDKYHINICNRKNF